jgi:uncharacterized protein
MCKGQCPGTAINGDWRNRTEHCEVWKAVFAHLESDLLAESKEPLSLSSRRQEIEREHLNGWAEGHLTSTSSLVPKVQQPDSLAQQPVLNWRLELDRLSGVIAEVVGRGR